MKLGLPALRWGWGVPPWKVRVPERRVLLESPASEMSALEAGFLGRFQLSHIVRPCLVDREAWLTWGPTAELEHQASPSALSFTAASFVLLKPLFPCQVRLGNRNTHWRVA